MIAIDKWARRIEAKTSGFAREVCLSSHIENLGTHYKIRLDPSVSALLTPDIANVIRQQLCMGKDVKFAVSRTKLPDLPLDFLNSIGYKEQQERYDQFVADPITQEILHTFAGSSVIHVD